MKKVYSKWVFKYGVGVLEFIRAKKKFKQYTVIKSRYKLKNDEMKNCKYYYLFFN